MKSIRTQHKPSAAPIAVAQSRLVCPQRYVARPDTNGLRASFAAGRLAGTQRGSRPSDTRVEFVARQIMDRIASGAALPGSRLPSERDLAAGLSVSRSVVREAIRVLEWSGTVVVRHGSGCYVADAPPVGPAQSPPPPDVPSSEELLSLLEFRRVVETECAALAAARRTVADLDDLHAVLKQSQALLHPSADGPLLQDLCDLDAAFHRLLAAAARSPFLGAALLSVKDLVLQGMRLTFTAAGARRANAGHRSVYDAVAASDPSAARIAMFQHLEDERLLLRTRQPLHR